MGGEIRIVSQNHTPNWIDASDVSLVDDGVVQKGKEIPLLGIARFVTVINDVPDDGDLRGVAAVTSAADRAGGIGGAVVPMLVTKDIALDPGIGAVEVPAIIVATADDIANKMHDGIAALAAGEI